MPANAADVDELPLTSDVLALMLDLASEHCVEPHLALTLPTALPFRRYDAVALALRAAANVHEVLSTAARFASLVLPALDADVRVENDEVRFHARFRGHPRGLGLHADEYVLAFLLAHCAQAARPFPSRAWLSCPRPRDLVPLFQSLGTRDVAFGSEDVGLAFTQADADAPLPDFDPRLRATAEHLASAALALAPRRGALAETVRSRIERALPGDVGADAIASGLHMSARTLQRRLEEEGTRFSEVVDTAREKLARQKLRETTLTLAEIAYQVGFSDVATFSRAFKRWTGLSPGAFRRR
ncbi:Transcriptional regulator, AraC family [Labilithrix luteola]|uniref:Transcriptional regulator, AraC family n=1 Tax=Labilithrix luteola TaxID=1391654 RepID=A0A0K1QB94_9BACT|nr:Transcriptional regulator, AraC family [Labilithrix luteola]